MTITNYTELVAAVPTWFTDRTELAPYVPDFITLSENMFNFGMSGFQPLRVREMETVVSLPSVTGVATLPTDYLQYRRLVPASGNRYPIKYTTPDGADVLYPTGQDGLPCHFTIVGSSLYTYPKTSDNVELTYYAKIPALTAAAPTNWLLTTAPSLYLHACIMQAADFIRKEEEVQRQAIICQALMDGLSGSDFMANYARAGVTLRGNTP